MHEHDEFLSLHEDSWEILCEILQEEYLPANFNNWDLADDHGVTIAHIAAANDKLPDDFDEWGLEDDNGWTVAHEAAAYGNLPPEFDEWNLADDDDWSVAHEAASHGFLPISFNNWEIKDNNGWSVAHAAASRGYLPEEFNKWHISDNNGWTVLQEINEYNRQAKQNNFIDDTNCRNEHDEFQSSLFFIIANDIEECNLPVNFDNWNLKDQRGYSIAHIAAKRGILPNNFTDWIISDNDGWTVAHEAAKYGHLPPHFKLWDLKDNNYKTVKEVYNERKAIDMSGDLIFRYASLRKELSKIQNEIDSIQNDLIKTLQVIGRRVEFDEFILHTYKSKKWSYSSEVKELEDLVKDIKRKEIKAGKAKLISETDVLKFSQKRKHACVFP